MKCLICQKEIIIKKNFENLFSNKKYYICNSCYNLYQISFHYQVFKEEHRKIHWFSMFEDAYTINYQAFILEFSQLFDFVIRKMTPKDYLFFFDSFLEYKKNSTLFSYLEKGEIFVITYY